MTNYYELYYRHGLPLDEAYYLAEYNYYITKDPIVKEMVKALRKKICNTSIHQKDDREEDICRRFMNDRGYYEVSTPFIFQPASNIYKYFERPNDHQIRNMVNYFELYKSGLVSLREAYVLAENKMFRLYDLCMLDMIFAIEDEIFYDLLNGSHFVRNGKTWIKKTKTIIMEHISKEPRKRITGWLDNKMIGWLMTMYMEIEGYTYDNWTGNCLYPVIKT